jgi:hypothetical protein
MKKFLLVIIGILFLAFLFFFWGGSLFTKLSIENSVADLRDSIDFNETSIFTYSQLEGREALIKNFFRSVIDDSTVSPLFITVKQKADFKTDLNSDWFPLTATEYFTTVKPNFLWNSKMKTSSLFWVNAIDSYIHGKGNMLIKLNSSITVADSWGVELDKSGLFRYISEAVLFPTKLLPSENLLWNVLDSNIAEIKFVDNNNSVVMKLFFDTYHRVYKIETLDKYRALEDEYKKSLYTVYFSNYRYFEYGFWIPTYYEVEWDLPGGKFKYGKFNIEEIKYE